jgi:hypothetical protein
MKREFARYPLTTCRDMLPYWSPTFQTAPSEMERHNITSTQHDNHRESGQAILWELGLYWKSKSNGGRQARAASQSFCRPRQTGGTGLVERNEPRESDMLGMRRERG